jgi:hypothetical protein
MSTIDKNEAALSAHEQVCAERYLGINGRLKRLEQILICSCGFIIALLATVAFKIH